MSGRDNNHGRIHDMSTSDWKIVYLYEFDVDGDQLKNKHKEWLKSNLIVPAVSDVSTSRLNFTSDDFWWIGVMGTSTRTDPFRNTPALSKRRADAAKTFLQQSFMTVRHEVHEVSRTWVGETRPHARKPDPDDTEDALDLAVLIVMRKMNPRSRVAPPSILRPEIIPGSDPIEVTFCFYAERRNASVASLRDWYGTLYAIFTHKGTKCYYGWNLGLSAYTLLHPCIPKGNPGGDSREKIFAGYQHEKFPSIDSLRHINDYIDAWVIVRHTNLQIRVHNHRQFTPMQGELNRGELHLDLKSNHEFKPNAVLLRIADLPDVLHKSRHFPLPTYKNGKWVSYG